MSFRARIKNYINQHPGIKQFVHWMIVPKYQARPRLWVKWFLNPLFLHRGKSSKISASSRFDVVPFNDFYLGAKSTIECFTTINNGVGAVIIGARTRVGIGSVVIGPVHIGNDVILAQHVVVSGLNHTYEDITKPIKDNWRWFLDWS
jgi:hypothetical protein